MKCHLYYLFTANHANECVFQFYSYYDALHGLILYWIHTHIYVHIILNIITVYSIKKEQNSVIHATKISDVNLSAFIYKLFHEDFSSIVGTITELSTTCVFPENI